MTQYYQSRSSIDYSKLDTDIDPFEIIAEEENDPGRFTFSEENRRWSVLEKVNRNYRHFHDPSTCGKFLDRRCFLAASILAIFLTSVVYLFRVVLFNINLAPATYDFIIVGGGPAGGVIAKSLSDGGAKVLLLEAGDSPHLEQDGGRAERKGGLSSISSVSPFDIPILWSSISTLSELKWEDQQSDSIMAKALGGNSILGAMIYLRSLPTDTLKWNLPKIAWDELFKVYQLQECYHTVKNSISDLSYHHGFGGDLISSDNIIHDEFSRLFLNTSISRNLFPFNPDFNNVDRIREGIGYYQFNIWNGLRSTVVNSILKSDLSDSLDSAPPEKIPLRGIGGINRKLTIQLNSKVKKVLMESIEESSIEEESYKAYGVIYESNGQEFTASLGSGTRRFFSSALSPSSSKNIIPWKRSVILSAGSIMTPSLLINSGIGSCKDRSAARSMKVCSEGVGKNLQDHPSIFLGYKITDQLESQYPSAFELPQTWMSYLNEISRLKYQESSHNGAKDINTAVFGEEEKARLIKLGYVGTPGFSVGGFLISPFSSNSETPDIQFTVFPSIKMLQSFSKNLAEFFEKESAPDTMVAVSIALLQPDIKFEIKLDEKNTTSSTTSVEPVLSSETFYTRGLSSKDLNTFIWGISQIRQVLQAPEMEHAIEEEVYPGIALPDAELKVWIAKYLFTMGNWVGSVSMGEGADSPIDYSFRVKGVRGLVVADASVIPHVPSGNVQATVAAIASIAADTVLSDNS